MLELTAETDPDLINDLQTRGMRLVDPRAGHESRRGGAGPSDHKAVSFGDTTVMVPVHTAPAFESPYVVEAPAAGGLARVTKEGAEIARVRFPGRPRFYDLTTADGIPYNKIAVLHSRDVLATTILQTCKLVTTTATGNTLVGVAVTAAAATTGSVHVKIV
jgi:biotin synthase-related radical SAM superfamily protein